jgi:hypothetical protein
VTPATLAGSAAPSRIADLRIGVEYEGAVHRPSFAKRALFGLFLLLAGLSVGFVLFSPGESPAPAATSAVPVAAAPSIELPSVPPPQATPSVAPEPSAAKDDAPARGRKSQDSQRAPKSESAGASKLTGELKDLGSSVAPTEGPRAEPTEAAAQAAQTELGQGQVQATVARYTGGVKRSCWQPALETRDKDAPMSARVNVTITVAASGNVENVTTSGDPRGYPGLSSCIAGRVRGWQFPRSSDSTTLNVPFVFAAQ